MIIGLLRHEGDVMHDNVLMQQDFAKMIPQGLLGTDIEDVTNLMPWGILLA